MGMLTLSFFLLIGMANGCACKLIGIGLMILLNGISALDIFGHWRLPRMLEIL